MVSKIDKKLLEKAGRALRDEAKRHIESVTLRKALKYAIVSGPKGSQKIVLYTEYYWTKYYHDGRGPVKPRNRNGVLVYFTNPKRNDPRIKGRGYPKRRGDIRRLTKSEFLEGKRRNRERAKRGRPPIMIISQGTGPSTPKPFFKEAFGIRGGKANQILKKELKKRLVSEIKEVVSLELKGFKNTKAIARI